MAFTTVYHCSVSFFVSCSLWTDSCHCCQLSWWWLTGASLFGLFSFHMTWWINVLVTVLDVVTFPLQPYTLVSPSLVIFLTSFHHCVLLVKHRFNYVQHRYHVGRRAGLTHWVLCLMLWHPCQNEAPSLSTPLCSCNVFFWFRFVLKHISSSFSSLVFGIPPPLVPLVSHWFTDGAVSIVLSL